MKLETLQVKEVGIMDHPLYDSVYTKHPELEDVEQKAA